MPLLLVLLVLATPAFAAVPAPVRDTLYDWRCVDEDWNTISQHQRQDTAIVACQNAALASPGRTFYIEAGRYRVRVDGPTPTDPPDFEYLSGRPTGDSIHPTLPAGTQVRVWVIEGEDVRVNTGGSTSALSRPWAIEWAYRTPTGWSARQERIEWR